MLTRKKSLGPVELVSTAGDGAAASGGPRAALLPRWHGRRPPRCPGCPSVLSVQIASDYGSEPSVTSILDTLDLFLLPVTNPDGYVFSHTEVSPSCSEQTNRSSFSSGRQPRSEPPAPVSAAPASRGSPSRLAPIIRGLTESAADATC